MNHLILDEPVDTLKEGEVVVPKPNVCTQTSGNDQVVGVKKHAKTNNVTRRMILNQGHDLKDFLLMPPIIMLPTNGKVNHNYGQFTIGQGMVKIMVY